MLHFRAYLYLSLVIFGSIPVVAADVTDIEVDVAVSGSFFAPGEEVTATVTQCNPTDETITQPYNCPCCHDQLVWLDADNQTVANCSGGCILTISSETWLPGECKSRDFSWQQQTPECSFGEQVPDGTYRAQHIFQFDSPSHQLTTFSFPFVIGDAPIVVPTLSELALAALALILGLVALLKLRARS